MDVFILYVLPVLVVSLECFIARYCFLFVDEEGSFCNRNINGRKLPRIIIGSLVIISCIPVIGTIAAFMTTVFGTSFLFFLSLFNL
jgi:hypothetical protein